MFRLVLCMLIVAINQPVRPLPRSVIFSINLLVDVLLLCIHFKLLFPEAPNWLTHVRLSRHQDKKRLRADSFVAG